MSKPKTSERYKAFRRVVLAGPDGWLVELVPTMDNERIKAVRVTRGRFDRTMRIELIAPRGPKL